MVQAPPEIHRAPAPALLARLTVAFVMGADFPEPHARFLAGLLGAAGLVLATAVIGTSTAWSCVAMASLDLTPSVVHPGQDVQFSGSFYHDSAPVILHWDSLDGPVLATVAPGSLVDFRHAHWRAIEGRFAVPGDATPGAHVVVATQEGTAGKPTWGVPARAAIQVGAPGPARGTKAPGGALARLSALRVADQNDGAGAVAPVAVLVALASCGLTVAVGAMALRTRPRGPRTAPP